MHIFSCLNVCIVIHLLNKCNISFPFYITNKLMLNYYKNDATYSATWVKQLLQFFSLTPIETVIHG